MKKSDSQNSGKTLSHEAGRKVLLAGMAVFAEKGYRGATVRDIVERIGCSVSAVSTHYGSKEGLARAVVEDLDRTLVRPVANKPEEIRSDYAWRVAVKRFMTQVVDLFTAQEGPNRYFASLYRHESANPGGKAVTLHARIVRPLFHALEGLVGLGVADRDPVAVRLATLALWNMMVAYALKHPNVLAEDVPAGIDLGLFRDMTIDYMVEKGLSGLRFVPPAADSRTRDAAPTSLFR